MGDNETPASVGSVAVGGFVTEVAAGGAHSCAILDTDDVRCWGLGESGRLGYGNTDTIGDDEAPSTAGNVFIDGPATQVVADEFHTCARKGTALLCWGAGLDGRLGYGNLLSIGDDERPADIGEVPVGGAVVQVDAGGTHTCARLSTGAVRCWGAGFAGQLGYGNIEYIGNDEFPSSAGDIDLGGTASDISTGERHSCAVMDTGTVRCWGWGFRGRLGYGNEVTIGDDETPASAGDVPLF